MRKLICLFLPLLLLASCGNDKEPVIGTETGTDETVVSFTTDISASAQTRANDVDEGLIKDVNIYVFHDNAFAYRVSAYNLSRVTDGYSFDAKLKATTSAVSIYLLANTTAYPQLYAPSIGEAESDVRNALELGFQGSGVNGNAIPMFGEYTFSQELKEGEIRQVSGIKMLRAFAAVTVYLSQEIIDEGDFELESIQVFRTNDKIKFVPDNFSGVNITEPTIPTLTNSINTTALTGAGTILSGLYIPESEWYTSEEDRRTKSTCVVIGGKYKKGETSYYRVDFTNTQNQNTGRVLRNHKYAIKIAEVSADGWEDAATAATNFPTGLSTDIIEWDNLETDAIFLLDGNYLAISSRILYLPYYIGATKQFSIDTDIPEYTIQWVNLNGTPVSGEATLGESLSTSRFKATVAGDGSAITIETYTDNDTGELFTEYLRITAGRIQFMVIVNQESRNMREYITIFNLIWTNASLGDEIMGNSAEVSARGLRNLLKNTSAYGMDGVVKFPGFYYGGIGNSNEITAPLIQGFDILYIPPLSGPSTTSSKNISEWLVKGGKFLVVCMDADKNKNLMTELGFTYNSDWAKASSGVYTLSTSPFKEVTEGPFGTIPSNYSWSWTNELNGGYINKSMHPEITPILVCNGNENQITLGVDLERRIFYVGNMFLFGDAPSGGISGNMTGNGNISNNHDRLIANMWAYLAEQVLK